MNKTQEARLIKLGKHLLNGGVHLPKWDFGCYISNSNTHGCEKILQQLVKTLNTQSGKAYDIPVKNLCGSAGCALGEYVIVFPRKFKLGTRYAGDHLDVLVKSKDDTGKVLWKALGRFSTRKGVTDFFGLDHNKFDIEQEYETLFSYNISSTDSEIVYESGKIKVYTLPATATMQEVGNNILNYIKFRKHEQATK